MDNAKHPLISVIIPNHNYSKYLQESIESVLAQTYTNFELIIVDDGSTDDSINTIIGFGDRVKLIEQAQAGVSAARNTGFRAAKGDYICFLDADDVWLPEKLEIQAKTLCDDSIGLVYSSIFNCNDELEIVSEQQALYRGKCSDIYLEKPTSAVVLLGCSNAMIKRELIHRVGGFNTTLNTSADWDFFRRISNIADIDFDSAPQVLYRRHAGSMSTSNLRKYYSDNERAIKVIFAELETSGIPLNRKVIYLRLLAKFYFGAFRAILKSGDILGSILQILKFINSVRIYLL